MKFCSTLILAAGFLAVVSAANPSGCLGEVIEGTDYFEDKVEPVESAQWSIEYNNTYKIVTNIAADETYLLYQCGTNPPTDQLDGRHATVVQIPFTAAAIISTTMIPFLELLGLRNKISTYLGDTQWVASPCLRELIDDENVIEVLNTSNETNYEGVPEDLPAFINHYGDVLLENSIRISVTEEITNLAVYEWIKYYSVFFNLEDKSNEIFEETQSQYECVESNAGIIETDMQKKPVVLWGSYSDYCDQGWSVARCPEYYCEFATACSATMLSSKEGSIQSDKCGSRNYMTTEEFVAFGKDADIWIYPGTDANAVLAQFEDELKDFLSVKNKKVYDTSASGSSAWFEYRLAEPHVVLQDFCSVVGTENESTSYKRSYIRDVYTEAVGDLGQCTDVDAPLVTDGDKCVALPAIQDGSSAAVVASFFWILLAAVVMA